MTRIPLTAEKALDMASGATELRIPVKPQPEQGLRIGSYYGGNRPEEFILADADGDPIDAAPLICPYPVGSMVALTETFHLSLQGATTPPGFIRTLQYEDITRGPQVPIPPQWYEWFDRLTQSDNRYCWAMRPAITMPAEFSRFKRRVVSVRVEHGETWDWVLTLEAVK